MAIFKSLSILAQTVTRTGGIEIQSPSKPLSAASILKSPARPALNSSTITNVSKLFVKEPQKNVNVIVQRGTSFTTLTNTNLEDLISNATNSNRQAFPPVIKIPNLILPSYRPGPNRNKSINDLIVPTRKLEAYENLTGISQDRPEILLLTPFKPLFQGTSILNKKQNYTTLMTNEGIFVESRIQLMNLQFINMINMLKTLSDSDQDLKENLKIRSFEINSSLNSLHSTSKFLLNLIIKTKHVKDQLDLRNSLYNIDTKKISFEHQINFSTGNNDTNSKFDQLSVGKFISKTFTFVDILESQGFDRKVLENIFTSTKLWMQMLYEYKRIIKNQSDQFLNVKTKKKTDQNSTNIFKDSIKIFNVSTIDPPGLQGIADLAKKQVQDVADVVNITANAFDSIYSQSSFESDESKVALLSNALCKEYSYSRGLLDPSLIELLRNSYQYTVSNGNGGNLNVFDNVLGQFPSNVLSIPLSNLNSLVSLSQVSISQNVAVLPFESKYLDGDSGFVTPGASWYIDQIFQLTNGKFDVKNLDELLSMLKTAYKNYNLVLDRMNINMIENSGTNMGNVMLNPTKFVQRAIDLFSDKQGNTFGYIQDDPMTNVFVMALQSKQLKALLFLFSINQISRSYNSDLRFPNALQELDSSPFTDELVNQIGKLLVSLTRPTSTNLSEAGTSTVSLVAIKKLIRKGTLVSTLINSTMLQVYHEFKHINAINLSGRTVYSGHLDTIMMMVVFDTMITSLAMTTSTRITGRLFQPRIQASHDETFIVHVEKRNVRERASSITNKLQVELGTIQSFSWLILETIRRLSDSLTTFYNFLNSPQAITNMASITTTINNPEQMKFLLSEQQIMLLNSNVDDILAKFKTSQLDMTRTNTQNDEIKILDDVNVPLNVKNVLYETLIQPEFSTKKALNKKILTVGLPLDFSRRLSQKGKISTQATDKLKSKQLDIVKIFVYRIDTLNQDIVFKPQKLLFELSRFPVRNFDTMNDVSRGASIQSIIGSVALRDFGESLDENSSSAVSYYLEGDANSAFNSPSYEFLSLQQKRELARNHVLSYMLEIYIKLLTGISTSDHSFTMDANDEKTIKMFESTFIKLLIEKNTAVVTNGIANTIKQSQISSIGTFFSSNRSTASSRMVGIAGSNKNLTFTAATSLASLPRQGIKPLMNLVKLVSKVSNLKTTISDGVLMSKNIIRPRQFDRVFNVIIDPDDFEINYEATIKTEYGKKSFEQLIKKRIVIPVDSNDQRRRAYKFRENDISQGSASFDKYFVTLGTFDEE